MPTSTDIRALVIDDELPARSELAFLLDDIDGITVVGEAGNVRDAVALIKKAPAEVIFLDINMPGITGLQLAEGLKTSHPNPPALVFVTAHSQFAVKAFDVDAIDYLVKPVETARLRSAVDKVRARLVQQKEGVQDGDAGAQAELADQTDTTKIMVSKGGKKLFIPIKDVCYIMAKDDYSYIFTADDRFLSTKTLVKIESQFEDTNIFRIHRRYLINLSQVTSVNSIKGGALTLTVEGAEEELPVSRRRVPALKQALEL
ncbi:MAG: LytTR family DNA-binding domain-containing protein [Coriobacteriia bacterium]|nr:LytTR family DNA-binding domain-containing protein [Coriobacteriia bacterium]MCL2746457.1 LytTR family DNA-binding domain-containing protein [Coriobacteriia bacterium]MCL2870970.1 LytTR family DNA-binding domain-containing protein [Coriobacteriia bacterium]